MSQIEWPPNCDVTLDAVRSLHTPSGHYRISPGSYPAGTSFSGFARAGRVYILSGACSYTFGDSTVQLTAPSYFDHPEGGYNFAVDSVDDVSLVHVWLLQPDFRRNDP
ncbi:MAG: hypothetical protein ACE361_20475 [Aureliella sp.]